MKEKDHFFSFCFLLIILSLKFVLTNGFYYHLDENNQCKENKYSNEYKKELYFKSFLLN